MNKEAVIEAAESIFEETFNEKPMIVTYAPGRLNFGGEHCDYMGGWVFPFATTLIGAVAGCKRAGKHCRIYSQYYNEMIEFDCDESLVAGKKGEWGNYFKGLCHFYLQEMLTHELGFDMCFVSNVTIGGGISSSAAVELSMGLFIEQCLGIQLDKKDTAMRGYHAEHEYVGMPCGVMDQLTSSCARYGHIALIDTVTQEITHYPIGKEDPETHKIEFPVTILKLYVHVEHKLVTSAYPDRVKECIEGERLLKLKYNDKDGNGPVKALCRGTNLEMLENMKDEMPKNVYDRCYHMIRETGRTLSYVKLIQDGDWDEIGRLFFQSYDDTNNFFNNGHPDLTKCVNVLKAIGRKGGVYGGRMLGGGWGGSILCLIEKGKEEELIPLIQKKCDESIGKENSCDVLVIKEAGAGAGVFKNLY